MASVKLKFRPAGKEGAPGTLYYQVIHDRKACLINTRIRIDPSEWDEKRGRIVSQREEIRKLAKEVVTGGVSRIKYLLKKMESGGILTLDDLADEYNRYVREYSLFKYTASLIRKMRRCGKMRTAETYTQALNSIKTFLQDQDVMLDRITADMMERFQAWHTVKGNSRNTVSFYIRILRAIYNRAVCEGIIENRHPFRRVYTGNEKTAKRALPLKTIKKIRALDLTDNPRLEYARDIFILSFMLRGMSFVDMAYLRKKDLRGGTIRYRRRKTGQVLTVAWTRDMQRLLDKYPENKTEYLLPIIKRSKSNSRFTYRRVCRLVNERLKDIARMTGITSALTLYVARHSWASAARAKGVPLSVISEGMGHDRETTTRIYLASLETSVVDDANELILSCI